MTSETDPSTGGMLDHLQGLLQQLEAAGGAPDVEARQALERLQGSLLALEAAKAGQIESNNDKVPSASDPLGSIPQQMEQLQGRVGNLERRLGTLDEGTQQILGGAAGGWVEEQLEAVKQRDVEGHEGQIEAETTPTALLPPEEGK